MVVTSDIERAIQYFHAIRGYLLKPPNPYRTIVTFSGEHENCGATVTLSSLNGFSSNLMADKVGQDPYWFLVVAGKFQTGFDA